MKIVSLYGLYSRNDAKSIRMQERLIEIACFDPRIIGLCLKVTSLDNLWEADRGSILDMHSRSFYSCEEDSPQPLIETEGTKVRMNETSHEAHQYYLVLNQFSVNNLRGAEAGFSSYFSSALIVMQDGVIKEIFPNSEKHSERVFVLCREGKYNNKKLNIEDYDSFVACGQFLYVYADSSLLTCKKYKNELQEIVPELLNTPDFIKKKIKSIPRKYKNIPERLEVLASAYKKFWENKNLDNLSENQIESINKNVRDYLEACFKKSSNDFNEETKTGKKIIEFSVKLLEPDYLKYKFNQTKSNFYCDVPIRLWILFCAAEYFWRGIDRNDISAHAKGVHVEKVLKLFGGKSFLGMKNIYGRPIRIDPFKDAMQDYGSIMTNYPELRYFPDVGFGSDAGFAASIIRPSWAKAKSKGGGEGSYTESGSNREECYMEIHRVECEGDFNKDQ